MLTQDTRDNLPVELADEPIVGWRCWYALPQELTLRPIYMRGLVWKPRQAHEAMCPEEEHEVPADGCKCGVWAVCHPMLLSEVGLIHLPPDDSERLPGVLVVGQVALWGKVIQHSRGWRAAFAYPKQLYTFTHDAAVAEGLRERYLVPVVWGQDAERLRRLLPAANEVSEERPLADVLLELVCRRRWPSELRNLVHQALATHKDEMGVPIKQRIEHYRSELQKGATISQNYRASARRRLMLADADRLARHGDVECARRATWVRLVRWQRDRIKKPLDDLLRSQASADELRQDLLRGTTRSPGRPRRYAPTTLAVKRSCLAQCERWIAEEREKLGPFLRVPIPTYREWRTLTAEQAPDPIVAAPPTSAPPELQAWYRRALQAQAALERARNEIAWQRQELQQERSATRNA